MLRRLFSMRRFALVSRTYLHAALLVAFEFLLLVDQLHDLRVGHE
jgi:hypothetical protein